MVPIFRDQMRSLLKLVPELRIVSADAHFDETSSHLHIIAVPVASGYKTGMEKRVSKTKVFTQDRLSYLQDRMRENAERGIELNPQTFGDAELKEKEEGFNKDVPVKFYKSFDELKRKNEELVKDVAEKEKEIQSLQTERAGLKAEVASYTERLLSEKEAEGLRKKTDRSLRRSLKAVRSLLLCRTKLPWHLEEAS